MRTYSIPGCLATRRHRVGSLWLTDAEREPHGLARGSVVGCGAGVGMPHARTVVQQLMAMGASAYYPCEPAQAQPYSDMGLWTGANLILDGDCADTTKWTVGNSATLSNQAGGHTGACMRIARNGVNNPFASQTVVPANARVLVSGWTRGDGLRSMYLQLDGATVCVGAAANTWAQQRGISAPAGAGVFRSLVVAATVDGYYSEVDDLLVARIPILTALDSAISGGTQCTTAATVATHPTWLDRAAAVAMGLPAANCLCFDGVAQYAIGQVLHASNPWSVALWFRKFATDTTMDPLGSYDGTRLALLQLFSGTSLKWYAGGAAVTHDTSVTDVTAWHHCAVTRTGTSYVLYLDGVAKSATLTGTLSTQPLWIGARNNNGSLAEPFPGAIIPPTIAGVAWTAAQVQAHRVLTAPPGAL
jgi:hypothetical protein